LLNVVASSCQSLVNLVIVAADRPWLVPRNCVNAGPKSELDRPSLTRCARTGTGPAAVITSRSL